MDVRVGLGFESVKWCTVSMQEASRLGGSGHSDESRKRRWEQIARL